MGGDLTGKRSGSGSSSSRKKRKRKRKRKKRPSSSSSSGLSPSSSGSYSESSPERRGRSSRRQREERRHRREKSSSSSRKKRKSSRRDRDEEEEERKKKRMKHRRRSQREEIGRKDAAVATRSESSSSYDGGGDSEHETLKPEATVRHILKRFPDVAGDLEQLLQMIDNGQAVDVRGISNRPLVQLLKKLFWSLNLTQNDGVFLLPSMGLRTLDVVGPILSSHVKPRDISHSGSPNGIKLSPSDHDLVKGKDDADVGPSKEPQGKLYSPAPVRRRLIGPEMPSSELLAAAAELTEAETALRDADMEVDDDLFIGPPPPAVVAEAESANEAERFEEVTRIVGVQTDKPYDVLGVNWKMSIDNVKKRYWKLSLMVHPDKCSHPQAHQAFVALNKAFKELQDPDKRKEMDEKIKLKEEQEQFKAELQALREAAQWRRLQGISMEGDEELLAEMKQPPKRDEWMTTLPPEKKPGMTTQSTSFSKRNKEGRGDTSVWTDSPLNRAEKAKRSYLEAYNKTTALAASDDQKKKINSDADLVDKYNRSKRPVSLVQKHQEESSRKKKKLKKPEKEEDWVGQHPWKPWDREKDITAGRQKVNLDSDDMAQGLTSRFSSGTVQRNFL